MIWQHVLAPVIVLVSVSSAAEPNFAPFEVQVVRDLLGTPEAQLNIGEAALKLSTLYHSQVDVAGGLAILDRLAARVNERLAGRTDADTRIRAINTVLFLEQKYEYDKADMMGNNAVNATLWGLLTRHKGNCISLPVLWYAVAERLALPVFAVSAPQHLFLRYDDGRYRTNIEATSGGGPTSDERLIRDLEIPPEAIRSGSMMRSLGKRELLLELIANVAVGHMRWLNFGVAEALLDLVLKNAPENLVAHHNMAVLLAAKAAVATSYEPVSPPQAQRQLALQKDLATLALQHAQRATRLGAVPPVGDNYWQKVGRLTGTEVDPTTPAAKPFDLARFLRPGGHPISVQVTADRGFYEAACGPLEGSCISMCASACGPAPGNFCAMMMRGRR